MVRRFITLLLGSRSYRRHSSRLKLRKNPKRVQSVKVPVRAPRSATSGVVRMRREPGLVTVTGGTTARSATRSPTATAYRFK